MEDTSAAQNTICNQAFAAETSGRLEEAIAEYRRAIRLDASNPTPYLFLGYALDRAGDDAAAVQVYSLAADVDARAINAWRSDRVSPEIRERSRRADRAVRAHFTKLHADSVAEFHRSRPDADLDRIYAAVWCQTHVDAFEYRQPNQRPHVFYVPDLAPVEIFDPADIAGAERLESAWEDIRAEYVDVESRRLAEHRPYVESSRGLGEAWRPLVASTNWGSIHLYKQGQPNRKALKLFPKTWDALRDLPLVCTEGRPREVLFSILEGGQYIPPHFGLSNTDATAHLPLVVPAGSAIRVGDTVTEWQPGKLFAFDDSFDHESWNRSPEPRVNLLFEVWHPDLSRDERDAIAACFEARDRWNRARRIGPAPADAASSGHARRA